MQDLQRKQKLFYNRAHHRLRQIQFSCRQVINLSSIFNTLASEISDSEVNSKKLEIIKTEIKQKLRQFATNIDQIYKILDRKIIIILKQLKNTQKTIPKDDSSTLLNKGLLSIKSFKENSKQSQSENGKQNLKSNMNQRIFSDTLNPRIINLECKISEYQQNQIGYKKKIIQLKQQNLRLVQEFDRLSNASNKTINQLKKQVREREKEYSREGEDVYQGVGQNLSRPSLNFTPSSNHAKNNNGSPVKNKKNQLIFQKQQNSREQYEHFYEPSSHLQFYKQPKQNSILNFGCMPTKPFLSEKPSILNMQTSETLDRNDRNRRWDLMLNKLRTSQQQSTEGSCQQLGHYEQRGNSFTLNMQLQERNSSFGGNMIRKHQI